MTHKPHRYLLSTIAVLSLTLWLALTPLHTFTAQAQGPGGPQRPTGLPGGGTINHIGGTEPLNYIGPNIDPEQVSTTLTGPVNIIIELEEPPSLVVAAGAPTQAQATTAARNQIVRVETVQQTVLNEMNNQGLSYTVLGSTERAASTLIVRGDASTLARLNRLPGVTRAYVEQIGYVDTSTSVPFIGAPTLWSNGLTGSGIRIGVIDDGIDYDHVNFGGNGDGTCDFATEFGPGNKVAGGYDFVGDTWTPGDPLNPDSDPCPQYDHGSHVAGIVGGYGVEGGATYTGSYPPTNILDLDIGPGVAPEAELYALKIGADGGTVSSAAAILAIEWAVDPDGNPGTDDAMHVVNQSWGISFGDPNSAVAQATNNAALAGVIMVGSGGNEGEVFFSSSAPNNANRAIGVAGSADGNFAIEVTASTNAGLVGNVYEAIAAGFGAPVPASPGLTLPLVLVNDASGGTTACDNWDGSTYTPDTDPGFQYFTNQAAVTGNFVLVDRGGCPFAVKFANAEANGASGIIVATNNANAPPFMTASDIGVSIAYNIPGMAISQADGQTLRAAGNIPLRIRMSDDLVYGPSVDSYYTATSHGPQRQPSGVAVGIKPDIAAPGETITSTSAFSGNGFENKSGTSQAAPHVAGTMALLRQLHPTWTVAELKALVINSAQHKVNDGTNDLGPSWTGVGRLDAANAYQTSVIAYNVTNPEVVSVSFGVQDILTPGTQSQQIAITNYDPTGASITVTGATYEVLSDMPGVTISVSGVPVTVPPGQTHTITVTVNSAGIHTNEVHSHDPALSETQTGWARQWLGEEGGLVRLSIDNTYELWVPVYAALRPAGDVVHDPLVDPIPLSGLTGSSSIGLTGTQQVYTGDNVPYDVIGLVVPFELMYESPDDPAFEGSYDAADFETIGLISDYYDAGAVSNTHVYFGFSTYGEWSTLSERIKFQVFIDADQDGTAELSLWNWNYANFNGSASNDVLIPVLQNVGSTTQSYDSEEWVRYVNVFPGSPTDPFFGPFAYDTAIFQNSVVYFGARASQIGLTDGDAAFDFWVEGYVDNTLVEQTPVMSYDLEAQTFDFNPGYVGAAVFYSWIGDSIPFDWDFTNYQGPNPPCALLLHHHNIPSLRSDVVCFQTDITHDLSITKVVSDPVPNPGDIITYTLTVTNVDQVNPMFATVTDVLPAGVTFISATPSQGTYDELTGIWDVGQLLAGGIATMDIVASVDAGTAGTTITNTATVEGAIGVDLTPLDNTASVDIAPPGTPTEPSDTDGDTAASGNGGTGTAAGTSTTDPTTLPATGYPPSDDGGSSTSTILLVLAGTLAALIAGGVLLRRRLRA